MTEPYKAGTNAVPGFPRITHNPRVMTGKACIRGMRVTVSMVLRELAAGTKAEELLEQFPYLEAEDIAECLGHAAWLASDQVFDLNSAA
ncbi:MAG: DUF433 domain-containing protein [Beijerinckiaceae bacterium]